MFGYLQIWCIPIFKKSIFNILFSGTYFQAEDVPFSFYIWKLQISANMYRNIDTTSSGEIWLVSKFVISIANYNDFFSLSSSECLVWVIFGNYSKSQLRLLIKFKFPQYFTLLS